MALAVAAVGLMLATAVLVVQVEAAAAAEVLETAVRQVIQDHLATAAETETTPTALAALADHQAAAAAHQASLYEAFQI